MNEEWDAARFARFEQWKLAQHYSWQEAVKRGLLVKVYEGSWQELSEGKPILATVRLLHEVDGMDGLEIIWDWYVIWLKKVAHLIPNEAEWVGFTPFTDSDKIIWLFDDGETNTFMLPEDIPGYDETQVTKRLFKEE